MGKLRKESQYIQIKATRHGKGKSKTTHMITQRCGQGLKKMGELRKETLYIQSKATRHGKGKSKTTHMIT